MAKNAKPLFSHFIHQTTPMSHLAIYYLLLLFGEKNCHFFFNLENKRKENEECVFFFFPLCKISIFNKKICHFWTKKRHANEHTIMESFEHFNFLIKCFQQLLAHESVYNIKKALHFGGGRQTYLHEQK
jgi:hypothetical protein